MEAKEIRSESDLKNLKEGDLIFIKDLEIELKNVPNYLRIRILGKSRVKIFKKAGLQIFDNSVVLAQAECEAYVYGEAFATFLSPSKVHAMESAKIDLYGGEATLSWEAHGRFRNDTKAYLMEFAEGMFFHKSKGILKNYSKANFFDKSTGILSSRSYGFFSDDSTGIFFHSSTGDLVRNAKGKFYHSTSGNLWDSASASFYNWSRGTSYSKRAKYETYGDSKVIRRILKAKSVKSWLKWTGAEVEGDYVYLYKWVRTNYKDFYSNSIDYSKKHVKAPDFDPDYDDECGRGLHLATNPWIALSFYDIHKGRMLKFKVPIKDLYPYLMEEVDYPNKVRVPSLNHYIAELELTEEGWIEKKGV